MIDVPPLEGASSSELDEAVKGTYLEALRTVGLHESADLLSEMEDPQFTEALIEALFTLEETEIARFYLTLKELQAKLLSES